MKDTSFIPKGDYCYTYSRDGKHKVCPFWHLLQKGTPGVGYCSYMEKSDTDFRNDRKPMLQPGEQWVLMATGLLWDQVKECGINKERDDEPDDGTEP